MKIGCEFQGIREEFIGYQVNKEQLSIKYQHSTLKISCLKDYIDIVGRLMSYFEAFDRGYGADSACAYQLQTDYQFLFRGMANYQWEIEPSISVLSLLSKERSMVESLTKQYPYDFNDQLASFQMLAKMQHFGLPTRLCDFSLNPLVALYFACLDYESLNTDGRVIMCFKDIRDINSNIINFICSTYQANVFWSEKVKLNEFHDVFSSLNVSLDEYLNIYCMEDGIFFSIPNYISERENRQQSVFMIFPNWIQYNNWHDDSYISINESADSSQYFRGENADNICVWEVLNKIPERRLKSDFISILIENKSKANILRELSYFGISKSSLFPEIEHSAAYIKERALRLRNLNALYNHDR